MRNNTPGTVTMTRFLAFAFGLMLTLPALAQDAGALRRALDLVGAKNWTEAVEAAKASGPVGQDIIEWHRLRAGEGLLGDYESFLARRGDWPGLPYLRQSGEVAVARSTMPNRIKGYFGTGLPRTGPGALALIGAYRAAGDAAKAEAEAVRAWRDLNLTAEDEDALLALYAQALKPAHEARLDRLLWEGRTAEAGRMLPRVSDGWRALAVTRLALRADEDGVDTKIAAIPAALTNDPGLAYERFMWRARKGRDSDAAALIIERSTSAASLGNPEAWVDRRAILARALMRAGDGKTAYRVAASHQLTSGNDYADLEFVAGYVALQKLGDAKTALSHFRRLRAAVNTPISLSRAAYWEGRAHEVLGETEAARAAFAYGAEHQTAFYGLLSADRAGLPVDPRLITGDTFPDWRQAGFMRSSVLEAALLLARAGDRTLSKRFFLHLAESLSATELGQLADLALSINEPHIAVLIAKQSAERGVILPRAYFPVSGLVPDGLAVTRALALGIARRESEFDPAAVSPAGARGLMQVMPGTAKMMATRTGLPYEVDRLTTDPAYNAALGSTYLAQLIEEFGPAITLVAAGYNAGPGRPRRWITELGDPRSADVDPVDWIEHLPFTETRNYVMRVAESVVIYRARLAGVSGPVGMRNLLSGR